MIIMIIIIRGFCLYIQMFIRNLRPENNFKKLNHQSSCSLAIVFVCCIHFCICICLVNKSLVRIRDMQSVEQVRLSRTCFNLSNLHNMIRAVTFLDIYISWKTAHLFETHWDLYLLNCFCMHYLNICCCLYKAGIPVDPCCTWLYDGGKSTHDGEGLC